MNKQNKVINQLLLIIFIIALVSYLAISKKKHPPESTYPIAEVKTLTLKKSNVKLSYEYPATVAGYREVNIRSQANGILIKKLYMEGQAVAEGDILFKIDDKPYLESLKKSKAELASAKSNARESELNFKRSLKLFQAKAISTKEMDSAKSNYEIAKDAVVQAESGLKLAQLNLEYTDIKSPINGIASKEVLSEGNLINNGDLVTTIVQKDKLYLNFAYPETDYNEIKKLILSQTLTISQNDKLIAKLKLSDELEIKGIIDFTDSIIDSDTASIKSRVMVEDDKLMPGQFIRIIIDNLIYKDAITIPEKSIIRTPQGVIVYVLDKENKVSARPITLGDLTNEGYIVKSGLNDSDIVIYEGVMKVKPGQLVKPVSLK